VSEKDPAIRLSLNGGNDPPERPWAYDGFAAEDDRPPEGATSLVSLSFIKAAVRRSVRFWGALAVAGLLFGLGVYVVSPPAYQASTLLLLNDIVPGSAPGSAILDDQTVAQSRPVATLAVKKLGLREDPGGLLASYTATVLSPRVLAITVNAPSGSDAVRRANAVAEAYLEYRTAQLQIEQRLLFTSLDQQVSGAERKVQSIRRQIATALATPASSSQPLSSLKAALTQANAELVAAAQNTASQKTTTGQQTSTQIKTSGRLGDAALNPHHRLKPLLFHAVFGLIVGLVLGLGIVIIRALVSDRLRQRDDVASALGASVKLSVGTVRLSRWLPGRRGLAAGRAREVQRITAYLRTAVPRRSGRAAALALVDVDNPSVAALSIASLAVSCAEEGKQVVLVDLASGAPAARLLGAGKPGIRPVRVKDSHLVVGVPGRDNIAPVGPVPKTSPQAEPGESSEALVAAYAAADLMLTLTSLAPSLGADNLATWADDAVVMVTAGRSSWTKIHAVGEMIRLSGTHLISAVLVGADKTDESLGVIHTQEADSAAEVTDGSPHTRAEGLVIPVDRTLGGRPADEQ